MIILIVDVFLIMLIVVRPDYIRISNERIYINYASPIHKNTPVTAFLTKYIIADADSNVLKQKEKK